MGIILYKMRNHYKHVNNNKKQINWSKEGKKNIKVCTRERSGTMPSPWSPTLNVPKTTLCAICPTRFRGAPTPASLPVDEGTKKKIKEKLRKWTISYSVYEF